MGFDGPISVPLSPIKICLSNLFDNLPSKVEITVKEALRFSGLLPVR
jgi:hypothetical protein